MVVRTRIHHGYNMPSDLMLLHLLQLQRILLLHGSRPQAHSNGLHLDLRVQSFRLGTLATS
jgi:hypothetical protein